MPRPVTTRWWWLGVACNIALDHWKVYHSLAKDSVNGYGSASYPNIVGSSFGLMMKEETLYANILFMSCFSKSIITPHFEFLQRQGVHSKQAGVDSEAMLTRTFLLSKDIQSIQGDGWKKHPGFKSFVNHLYKTPQWPTKEKEKDTIDAEQKTFSPVEYKNVTKLSL